MGKTRRVFWLITLCLFLSGCSEFRRVSLRSGDPVTGEVLDTAPGHAPCLGDEAKVVLYSGQKHDGEIVQITAADLTLQKIGNYGLETIHLQIEDIESLEVKAQATVMTSPFTKGLLVITGLAAVLAAVALIHLSANPWGSS